MSRFLLKIAQPAFSVAEPMRPWRAVQGYPCRQAWIHLPAKTRIKARGTRSRSTGGCRARKNDPEFGEFAGPGIDLDRSAVLLDDNVVTQGEAQASPFARRFRRKEGIEYFLSYFSRNAAAIVTNPDFDVGAETSGRGGKGWFVAIPHLCFAFHGRIDAIRNQVEKDARDLLRKQIGYPGGGVKGSFQPDAELPASRLARRGRQD